MRVPTSLISEHNEQYKNYEHGKYLELLAHTVKTKLTNGILLTNKFLGFNQMYNIKCSIGHIIKINDVRILMENIVCVSCANIGDKNKKYEELTKIAELLNGKLISNEFIGAAKLHKWTCKNKHVWTAEPNNITTKYSWCPQCPKSEKKSKEEIKKIIDSIKSKKNISIKTKYAKKELEYIKINSAIYNKKSVKGLEDKLKEIFPDAKLKDDIFRGYCTGYPIICEAKHSDVVLDTNIMNGTVQCKFCKQFDPDAIVKLQKIAEDKHGKLLSTAYMGDKVHLKWQCSNDHIWEATPNNIKAKNSWCPYCLSYTNEERCRIVLNILLDTKLTKQCPDFLLYKNRSLELDGFDEKKQIAFEYNGIQHYSAMFYDVGTDTICTDISYDDDKDDNDNINKKDPLERLNYQKEKDQFKIDKCGELNIKLLVIPYWEIKSKKDTEIIEYIIKLINDNNILLSDENIKKANNLNIDEHMPHSSRSDKFEKLALNIISSRKGKLIKFNSTDKISSNRTEFKVQCRFGHISIKTYENISCKRNRWCPKCTSALLVPIVNKKNETLAKINIKILKMDRFGTCIIQCMKCHVEIKNVDYDDIENSLQSKLCQCNIDLKNINITELLTSILKQLHDANTKIDGMINKIDTFALLRDDGKLKRCKKSHWVANEYFENDEDICADCKIKAAKNYNKHKRCKHGNRVGKDRAQCKECSQENNAAS